MERAFNSSCGNYRHRIQWLVHCEFDGIQPVCSLRPTKERLADARAVSE